MIPILISIIYHKLKKFISYHCLQTSQALQPLQTTAYSKQKGWIFSGQKRTKSPSRGMGILGLCSSALKIREGQCIWLPSRKDRL